MTEAEWNKLTYDKKNQRLFLEQKRMLELFLERGAISQDQFTKSLKDMSEKMNAIAEPKAPDSFIEA